MSLIEIINRNGRPRDVSIKAGEDVNVWWREQRASLNAWITYLSNQGKLELPPEAVLLDVTGKPQTGTIFLEDSSGHIGGNQSWTFVRPDYDAVSVASINRLDPDLNSRIDYLARSLNLEPGLFRQGIARAHVLLAQTRIDRLSSFDKALEEHTAAVELDNGWSIRLRRFQPYFNGANALIGAVVEYYSKVRIQEIVTLPGGFRLGGLVCRSLIYERGIQESGDPASLVTRLLSSVLLLSSHAAEGDSYYERLLQEQPSLQAQF